MEQFIIILCILGFIGCFIVGAVLTLLTTVSQFDDELHIWDDDDWGD